MSSSPTTPHPRTIGWVGATALAMGGSNQSLFLLGALIVSQGSAAVPLLILGLLLSWAAAPGWTELILMWPNRVGGIAATCAEAFRPYSPVLANLTGVCYWWGWVPTCGLTAILSASAIHEWYLPGLPVPVLASMLVLIFTAVNLCGVRWVTRLAIPIASASASLAFISGLVPVLTGHVDWHRATTFHLTSPFPGLFGGLTSAMAGLYLIGFAAPAFEAAACHVGEMIHPTRNVPRAMFASGAMATLYFVLLPVIWLGVLGPTPLEGDLAQALDPTFAPLLGDAAHAAALWFMMLNMFHGTLQPLAGAARTLMQLAEDGLLPRVLAWRARTDAPWVATLLTAGMAIVFLLAGDPVWVIAAANLAYLIGIGLPNVAVWLLRRDAPQMPRPYRAPRGMIGLGLLAAGAWGVATILGFEQFGLPTVLAGLALAYSGSLLYALRRWQDRRWEGRSVWNITRSLHLKLTGAMFLVLTLDGAGYLLAVSSVNAAQNARIAALEDIFVAVAVLTLSVGLILPGMIAHAATEVAEAADRLARGTLADLMRAMQALSRGDLDGAHARAEIVPVVVRTRDEIGAMAESFNTMQDEVARAAVALDGAREGLREARDALTETNQQLIRANEIKSEFLAAMSHEIRTPMTGVIGMTELLLETPLGAEQRDYAEIVRDSAGALLVIINDILDFSKIEAGKLALEEIDFALLELVEGVAELLAGQARDQGLALMTYVAPDVPPMLRGDPGRLRQALLNLLSNALKFTERGEVVVRATIEATTEQRVQVRVAVSDTGIGLSDTARARLFQPFTQADGSTTRKYGGTGLGLSISKRLVELMGGQIGVESTEGQGSTFWYTVPLARSTSAEASLPASPASLRGLRALVVDDHATDRQILGSYLTSWGIQADFAAGGEEGLAMLRAATPVGLYAVALVDLIMPGIDGIAIARALTHGSAAPAIPLILMTAFDSKDQRADALRAGFAAFVTKPIKRARLLGALATVLDSPTRQTAPAPHSSVRVAGAGAPLVRTPHATILVADDNPINQKLALRWLQKFGYTVRVVANGREAVAAVRDAEYALILMDCQMPEMDGYAATRAIRQAEQGTSRHVPIVAVTANAMHGDREACLAAGMDDYLAKPLEQDSLRAVLQRWLSAQQPVQPAVMAPPLPPATPVSGDGAADPGAMSILDATIMAGLRDLAITEPGLLAELIDIFLGEASRLIERLREAVRTADTSSMWHVAHGLKGSSASMGAQGLAAACAQMEGLGRSGTTAGTAETLRVIEALYSQVTSALEHERRASLSPG